MLFIITAFVLLKNNCESFEKVIIWGHKLHSHTHSYIHNAFYRAFIHLGYPTYWFDDSDDVSNFDFSHCLFLTEGQVDGKIPIRKNCQYLLHNADSDKYLQLSSEQCLRIQVYTKDVLSKPTCTRIAPCIYFDRYTKTLYMPWATDLLPHEIDEIKKEVSVISNERKVYWIGTIGYGGEFGNSDQVNPFIAACRNEGVEFIHYGIYAPGWRAVSVEENQQLIASSYMAPAIVGRWQLEKGYIPCRIFKNISYGKLGITNSDTVYELFEKRIVYNPDTYALFYDAKKKLETMTLDELHGLMDFVKEKHTYLNRIELVIWAFEQLRDPSGNKP